MAHILGLDLGTNSIGWALIDKVINRFVASGSRIIPMDAAMLGDYEKAIYRHRWHRDVSLEVQDDCMNVAN